MKWNDTEVGQRKYGLLGQTKNIEIQVDTLSFAGEIRPPFFPNGDIEILRRQSMKSANKSGGIGGQKVNNIRWRFRVLGICIIHIYIYTCMHTYIHIHAYREIMKC